MWNLPSLVIICDIHQEMEGKTKQVNEIMEQYLHSYCSYDQHEWVSELPFMEHNYNISL